METGPILRAMGRNKARFALIAVEVALALAIIANAVSIVREEQRKLNHPTGFDDANLLLIETQVTDPAFKDATYHDNVVRKDLDVLRAMPGVRQATQTLLLPWSGGGSSGQLRPPGDGPFFQTQIYPVDDATIDTLGTRVVEGRNFTREDVERDTERLRTLIDNPREQGPDGKPKQKYQQDVLLTRAFARHLFGDGPLVGRIVEDTDGDLYRVIGLVDPYYHWYNGWPIERYAMLYANRPRPERRGTRYLVRAEPGRLDEVAAAAQERLDALKLGRSLKIQTIGEIKLKNEAYRYIAVRVMTGVIVALVVVTALGILGLTAFSVTERTRQIGTRRALGAQRSDILRFFLAENWLVTTIGLTLGIPLAIGLNVALVNWSRGTKLPIAYLLAGVFLMWLSGLAAAFAPALRASRIPPSIATRNV